MLLHVSAQHLADDDWPEGGMCLLTQILQGQHCWSPTGTVKCVQTGTCRVLWMATDAKLEEAEGGRSQVKASPTRLMMWAQEPKSA